VQKIFFMKGIAMAAAVWGVVHGKSDKFTLASIIPPS
jgi:hypothetical protein